MRTLPRARLAVCAWRGGHLWPCTAQVVTRGYREFKRLSEALGEAAVRASPPLTLPLFPSKAQGAEPTPRLGRALNGPDRAKQASGRERGSDLA